MILGTGIDIIEVSRVQASHERFGERFLKRLLLVVLVVLLLLR